MSSLQATDDDAEGAVGFGRADPNRRKPGEQQKPTKNTRLRFF
jgi:hypothetical protein